MKESLDLIKAILSDAPELREVYEDHRFHNREVLPHVLMGDIVRFVIENLENQDWQPSLVRLLAHLEEGLRKGIQEINDLIGTSFAENLIGEPGGLRSLWPLMGPLLKKDVENFCGTEWMNKDDAKGAT